MTQTVSKVLMNRQEYNDPMIDTCMAVTKLGGSFSITNVCEAGHVWFTVYVINWPDEK